MSSEFPLEEADSTNKVGDYFEETGRHVRRVYRKVLKLAARPREAVESRVWTDLSARSSAVWSLESPHSKL